MGNKMKILGAAVALAVSGGAQATDTILFDYNGAAAGGVISVGSFDWSPDNALAVGAVPIPTSPNTNTFDLYSQASLGNFLDANSQVINGTGLNSSFEITFQAGFTEVGTSTTTLSTSSGLGGVDAKFALAPTSPTTVNSFNIYYDTNVNANQITGTGYGDGTLILSGVVIGNTTTFSIPFTIDSNGDGTYDTPATGLLDNFGADNAGGVLTVFGNGGGQLQVDVGTADSAYFLSNILSLLVDMEFNTSQVTPFSQANPSDQVVGFTPVYGVDQNGRSLNGGPCATGTATCDFQFQADANSAFNSVPEPGSLLLLGAGLMGMGWSARRHRKA